MNKPLSHIKVLDLTTFVAAPVSARLLGDLGARVIKVEHPRGDGWREFGVTYNPRFCTEENPVFDIYNSGKEFISLNLKSPEGKEVFWKLLEESDVFVTNTRLDALQRLGFSYEDVKERCPRLVYAIVLGYGEKGPEAFMPAFDTSAYWTRSGFLRDMAPVTTDYEPISPPSGVGDTVTGYNLVIQICAALINREKTGKGDYVRAGLYHTGIFTNGTMEIITQKPWGRTYPKTRLEVGPPGGCYKCSDGEWLFIANGQLSVALPKMFRMIGREDLVDDPRFIDRDSRAAHSSELYYIFKDAYASKPVAQWLTLAQEFDLPLVRMNHFSDVTSDPQAWENGYLEHMECPNGETVIMPASPFRMESLGTVTTKPAAQVGTHTAAVLEELGYSAEEIAAMQEKGAVFCAGQEK